MSISLAVLLLANLVPLGGVLFFGWRVFDVMLLFWAENVIIGLFNVARMLALLLLRAQFMALMMIPFFIIHYGGFAAAHAVFLFAVFGAGVEAAPREIEDGVALAYGYLVPLLALVASHGVSFVVNFLGRGEFRRVSADELMVAPYVRVFILHITIILGALAVEASGQPVAALVLLIVLKTGVDAMVHIREHRRLASRPERANP